MSEPELKQKVEQLIAEHPVLLMMKGSPEQPGCGNSMRAVRVLDAYGVDYGALDVLPALDPLREVTGEIADWRTFPQLYVNGKLVGGADILEEMHASGELVDVLGADVSEPVPPDRAPAQAENGERPVTQSPPMQIEGS